MRIRSEIGTVLGLLLAALWCLSRTAMTVTALTIRYARAHGGALTCRSRPSCFIRPNTSQFTQRRTNSRLYRFVATR